MACICAWQFLELLHYHLETEVQLTLGRYNFIFRPPVLFRRDRRFSIEQTVQSTTGSALRRSRLDSDPPFASDSPRERKDYSFISGYSTLLNNQSENRGSTIGAARIVLRRCMHVCITYVCRYTNVCRYTYVCSMYICVCIRVTFAILQQWLLTYLESGTARGGDARVTR